MQPTDLFGNPWKMSGRILQSDINHGQEAKSDQCPLALAIKRELAKWFPERIGQNLFVNVGINAVYLLDVDAIRFNDSEHKDHVLAIAELPRKLYEFVRNFDFPSSYPVVKPQRFTLEFKPNPFYANTTI